MRRFILIAFLFAPILSHALSGVNGDCTIGGQQALTSGQPSTATQQIGTTHVNRGAGVAASFPGCNVTVYATGTLTKAVIFSDNNAPPTVLVNPFVANPDGSFTFFADSACYDITISSGAVAMPYSRTYAGVCLGGTGGGGGGGGGSGTVGPGTATHISVFTTANSVGNSEGISTGTSPVQWPLGVSLVSNALFINKCRSVGTGTTANLLVAFDANNCAINAQPTDTNNLKGIARTTGLGGNVDVAFSGNFNCQFDNQTAIGDWVTLGSGSQCHDNGASQPSGIEDVGRISSVNSGAGTLAGVDLGLPDVTNTSTGGGTGLVGPCAVPGALAYYSVTGSTVQCDVHTILDGAGHGTFVSLATNGSGGGVVDIFGSASGDCTLTVNSTGTTFTPSCPFGSGAGAVLLAPTADQTIIGAHALILSDPGSSFWGKGIANQFGPGEAALNQTYFNDYFGYNPPIRLTTIGTSVGNGNFLTGLGVEAQDSGNGPSFGMYSVMLYANTVDTPSNNGPFGVQSDVYVSPASSILVDVAHAYSGSLFLGNSAGVVNTASTYLERLSSVAGTVHKTFGYDANSHANLGDTLNAAFHSVDQGSGANNYGIYLEGVTHNNLGGGITIVGGMTFSNITGSVQCLHVNSAGLVSGTGTDCGAGGGGGVSSVSGTANQITVVNGSTTPQISIPAAFTFPGTVSNDLSIFGATTSAQLAGVISDETGTGKVVFGTSPTLVTPALGTPSALVLTNATGLPFSSLGSATNTTMAGLIGTGASLDVSGSGTINSTTLLGSNWAAPPALGTGTQVPGTSTFTNVTVTGTCTGCGTGTVTGITGGNPVQVTNTLEFAGPDPFASTNATLYGAKGDGTDNTVGAMTSGSNVITNGGMSCPGVNGMSMYMAGAGAAGVGLVGTITCTGSVKTLSVNASTNVTNAFTIWGTDNATAFNTAFAANAEVWIPCAAANSYYAVFSTVGLGIGNVKANAHKIHGAGAYDNRAPANACLTQIAWAGVDGGTLFSFDDTTHSQLDNLAIDGKSHAGIGLLETATNSVQSTHRNVYTNLVISSIMGSPGRAIAVAGNFHSANQDVCCSTFDHITILGGFFQHNTATGTVGTCYYQDGTQTTLVTLNDFQCNDFTSRGLDFEGGGAYVKGASFSSKQNGSNIDTIYLSNNMLAAQFIDVYDEMTATNDCPTRHSINLPSGSRTYPTTFINLRTYWGPTCTSGAAIATAQAGNVTFTGGSIEATSGLITSTFAQTGAGVLLLDNTWFQPTHSTYTNSGLGGGPGNIPTVSSATKGKYITNNGTVPSWSQPWFDVTGFGADPTGVADSATAIANAITACGSAGGGSILFPEGTYIHSSQIVLNQNNCYLVGNNRSATLKKNYNSTSVAAVVINASHVGIVGLTYDGNQGSFTGNCIQDNSANTDILIQNNRIINCNGNSLFFTAASGATAADHVNVFDNTIVCGTGTAANFGALGFQQTIHDVIVRHNILDCSNDASTAGVGAIQGESQGLVTALTNFLIEGNTITTPNPASNLGWGIQFGAYNAYMSTGVIISHNRILLGGDHTGGISVQQHSGLVVSNNIIDSNGHSPTYVGLELIALTGATVTGNTVNYDVPNAGANVPTGCFSLASFSSGTFTGNTCNGFGENAGVGLIVNITQIGQQAITACSESGNVATFTITAGMSSAWSPGSSVFLTGNTPAGYNTGNTPLLIQNVNYNRAAGTFSVFLPTSGLGACSGFGNVQSSSSNNTIAGNTINFPQGAFGVPTGTRVGIWLRGTNAGGHTDNNLISNNTVNGTGLANEIGIDLGGTGTDDSNRIINNNLNNLATGISTPNATLAYIGPNQMASVTTPLTDGGTANLVNSALPVAFGKLVACGASLEGNTAALTDVTTATWNTTVVGGGANHLRAGCNATNWVTQ